MAGIKLFFILFWPSSSLVKVSQTLFFHFLWPWLLFHLVGWFADIVSRLNVGRGLIAISVPLYNERDRDTYYAAVAS
ncbi:hypothetical protein V8C44DRAFT_318784 [Trichoderma aethiopicum]